MKQDVLIKYLDELSSNLSTISIRLNELKPQRKTDWGLIISILALVVTIYWNQNSRASQQQIQAATNWQGFLELAVNNSELANGLTTINGKSIAYLADKSHREELKKTDSAAYEKYARYTWFVAAALGSAESVFDLQGSDTSWNNTIAEAMRGHKALFDAKVFNLNSYGEDFRKLVERSFAKKSL